MTKIGDDFRSIKKRDPACRNNFEAFFLYSGFHALLHYRTAHFFHRHKLYFLARLISQAGRLFTGVEIHPGAKIGGGLFIDHGSGIVIGETSEIGEGCTIYQGATLGGTGKDVGKRHPTLGDDVLVGAGSKILGPINIGSHAKIAAGAVVLSDVPEYATAVGVPARIVRINGMKPEEFISANEILDQMHVPDPVAQELGRLSQMVNELQQRINELEDAVSEKKDE